MASKTKKVLGSIAQWGLPIAGALTGNPLLAAAGGAAGGALSGQKGALKQAGIGALAGYGGSKLLGGLFGGGGSTTANGSSANVTGMLQSAFNPMASGGNIPLGGSGAGLMPQIESAKSSFGFSGLKKNPLLLGAGIMGASQLIKSPQVPELPQSVMDFQNMARQGNPLQNQVSAALSQQLGQTQQDASQDEIDALTRQYQNSQDDEVRNLQSLYRSARPGTDYINDSTYQRDLSKINDRYATMRADSVAQLQRQISNDFSGQRAQQISQAAGLSSQQLQQMAQLSQFDLDRQLQQLQITDRDRQTLRDYLLQIGGTLATSQLDPMKALEMQMYQRLLGGGK